MRASRPDPHRHVWLLALSVAPALIRYDLRKVAMNRDVPSDSAEDLPEPPGWSETPDKDNLGF